MEKIIGDFDTLIKMDVEDATKVCRLGQGEKCCAFLVMGTEFECVKMAPSLHSTEVAQLRQGVIGAKGKGGWEGCPWEGK